MKKGLFRYDWGLFILAATATLLGIFFIFDAGYARSIQAGHGPIPREFRGQLIFLAASLLAYSTCVKIQAKKWKSNAKTLFWIAFALIIAVELPGVGTEFNGARRWIGFGPFSIQPAEFMKIAVIMYLAAIFWNRSPEKIQNSPIRNWGEWIDKSILPKIKRAMPALFVLIASYIIEREPDLGTAAVIIATAFALMIVGGISKRSLRTGVILGVLGVGFLVNLEPYRIERILFHSTRWSAEQSVDMGYQTTQSETALAGGGLMGVGIGSGRAKHMLPAATTDFIMATIGEEFGFIGSLGIIILLAALSIRLILLARSIQDRFSQLYFYGIAIWISVQGCVNIMMVNGTLPAIGIPLPFISSGGSSLLALWIALGICQSLLNGSVTNLKLSNKENLDEYRDNRRRHRRPRVSRA